MNVLMLCPDCQLIDRRVLQEARSLAQAGHRVAVLSGFECAQEQHYEDGAVSVHRYAFDWDDERLKRLAHLLPRNPRTRAFIYRAFRYVVRSMGLFTSFDAFVLAKASGFRADVVHVHDLPFLLHGHALARKWNVPLVFDAHEIYYEQEVLASHNRRRLRRLEQRLIGDVALFITVNDGLADHYQQLYGKRPLVLMNCADTPPPGFDAASRTELRRMAGLGDGATVVLYQGWISSERNLATLVQAAGHLPEDTYLALIGYGAYEQELRAIAAGQRWESKVRFLGAVPAEGILALTAGADLGVIPYLPIDLNHTYSSPNKFFEYILAGVPMVAHDLPFFRGMMEKYGIAALGDLSTVEGMAAAILHALGDADRLASMRAGCRVAARVLNWETEGRKLVEAYSRLPTQ
jgi:glycosyltransferase involved in cell wall biosynthesis